MDVREMMTADVPVVRAETRVSVVAQAMLARGLPAIPVVGSEGHLLGLVRASDMVARHARIHAPFYVGLLGSAIAFESRREHDEIRHALAVTAGDLMQRKVRTVAPTDTVEDAATILVDDEIEAVPVVEGGRVVGIVTEADVIGLLVVEESDDNVPED